MELDQRVVDDHALLGFCKLDEELVVWTLRRLFVPTALDGERRRFLNSQLRQIALDYCQRILAVKVQDRALLDLEVKEPLTVR